MRTASATRANLSSHCKSNDFPRTDRNPSPDFCGVKRANLYYCYTPSASKKEEKNFVSMILGLWHRNVYFYLFLEKIGLIKCVNYGGVRRNI